MRALLYTTAACVLIGTPVLAAEGDYAPLLAALPDAQVDLATGIAQVATGTEVPTEAKLELNDEGVLVLSVYTSEKGFDVQPEDNVFKEYIGPATEAAWQPETEVFEDFTHIARSAQYQTLLSITPVGFAEIVDKAVEEQDGTVFSVKARIHEGKPVFEVLSANGDTVETTYYDLMTGDQLTG